MRKYFLLLLLALVLVSCVSAVPTQYPEGYDLIGDYSPSDEGFEMYFGEDTLAYGVDFSTDHDRIVTQTDFWQPQGSTVQFQLKTYNGNIYSGESTLVSTGIVGFYNHTVTFNGVSHSESLFLFPYVQNTAHIYVMPFLNVSTNNTEIVVIESIFLTKFYSSVVADVFSDPIAGAMFSSDLPMNIAINTMEFSEYYAGERQGAIEQIGGIVWNLIIYIQIFVGIVLEMAYWIAFLIYNLPMIVALCEVGTLAIATCTSSNIFTAIKRWWAWNSAFIKFFQDFIGWTVNLVYNIKNSIPILRWL